MTAEQALTSAGVDTSDPRLALVLALGSQAVRQSERAVQGAASEVSKYVKPRRNDGQSLEEALMAVPDLETIPSKVVKKMADYEIRENDSYMVAETEMPSTRGFDFYGASQGFNILAGYIFGKNAKREEMQMTTPVFTQKGRASKKGEMMEMTTPVVTQKAGDLERWKMSFNLPSKYSKETVPVPIDTRVSVHEVPPQTVAVVAFSGMPMSSLPVACNFLPIGFVTDEEVERRTARLRAFLARDGVAVKDGARAQVSQYNPPFTLPFMRRNEVALQVEWTGAGS
eukprot:SM000032S12124  [mRNA]  locus=s32:610112:612330:+ [translate_table: standard]